MTDQRTDERKRRFVLSEQYLHSRLQGPLVIAAKTIFERGHLRAFQRRCAWATLEHRPYESER